MSRLDTAVVVALLCFSAVAVAFARQAPTPLLGRDSGNSEVSNNLVQQTSTPAPANDVSTVTFANVTYACQQCPPGSFADMKNTSSLCSSLDVGICVQLPGTCPYSESAHTFNGTLCTQCALGLYSSEWASESCERCPFGQQTKDGTTCTDCSPGQYTNASTLFCEECDWGTYSNSTSQFQCKPCPTGWHSTNARSGCVACPIHQNSTDGRNCKDCSPTMDCWNVDTQNCVRSCVPGEQAVFHDGFCVSCAACRPGTSSKHSMSRTCDDCPAGNFQPLFAQNHCNPCPPGSYQPLAGQVFCRQCEQGFYCNSTAHIPCRSDMYCPAGSVAPISCSKFYEGSDSGCKPTWQFITLIAGTSVAGVLLIGVLARYLYKSKKQQSGYVPITATPVYTGL